MSPRDIVIRLMASEPFVQAAGINLVRACADEVVLALTVREDMLNGVRLTHGGTIFALADTALAYLANAAGARALTAGATITYLASSTEGALLVATARREAEAGRTGVYTVHVTADDRPVAVLTGTARQARPNRT